MSVPHFSKKDSSLSNTVGDSDGDGYNSNRHVQCFPSVAVVCRGSVSGCYEGGIKREFRARRVLVEMINFFSQGRHVSFSTRPSVFRGNSFNAIITHRYT